MLAQINVKSVTGPLHSAFDGLGNHLPMAAMWDEAQAGEALACGSGHAACAHHGQTLAPQQPVLAGTMNVINQSISLESARLLQNQAACMAMH